jgi:hypothetical protein
VSTAYSLRCILEPENGVSRCAEERGVRGAEREPRLRPDFTRIRSSELQYWRISVMNFCSLAARFEERKGEKREEDAGYL